MILVRSVGASIDEQIAGLLHDISHTVLSHVIDWALSAKGESFHEVHKDRYVATTEIPEILECFGFPLHSTEARASVMDEEHFGLVERPAPHLCADRLDYGLRDSVSFGKLSKDAACGVFVSLTAYPSVSSPDRFLVLHDESLALELARGYLASDRDVWSNPSHVDMCRRTGQLIGDMVRSGAVPEDDLWRLSDKQFWAILRESADLSGREILDSLEQGPRDQSELSLPRAAKVRTIDPDVLTGTPRPLSELLPAWKDERAAYIAMRDAQRAD
jgi:HD superfamily phosphohydrolase